jgi:hypothetical protein
MAFADTLFWYNYFTSAILLLSSKSPDGKQLIKKIASFPSDTKCIKICRCKYENACFFTKKHHFLPFRYANASKTGALQQNYQLLQHLLEP